MWFEPQMSERDLWSADLVGQSSPEHMNISERLESDAQHSRYAKGKSAVCQLLLLEAAHETMARKCQWWGKKILQKAH